MNETWNWIRERDRERERERERERLCNRDREKETDRDETHWETETMLLIAMVSNEDNEIYCSANKVCAMLGCVEKIPNTNWTLKHILITIKRIQWCLWQYWQTQCISFRLILFLFGPTIHFYTRHAWLIMNVWSLI